MRHAAALRAGLAGHTVGGGGIERPLPAARRSSAATWTSTAGTGSIAGAGTAHAGGAKPTMKAYAAAERRVYPPEPQEVACRSAERAGRRQTARGD